jgi:predicted dehydrogenase
MLKIGIMGLGTIAHTLAKTVSWMEHAVIVAVGAREIRDARAFAQKYEIARAYGSYEALAADSEVELIYVASPRCNHYENMKLCIEYGKHILCEKAFTLNASQAKEIFSLAKRAGIFCTEAVWSRYMPSRHLLQKVLNSGVIGRPLSLTANLGYTLTDSEPVMDPLLGGGVLLDLGVHAINFALMAFGEDYDTMVSKAIFNKQGADVSDGIVITWEEGRIAVLHVSALVSTDRRGFIYGSQGFLKIHNISNCQQIDVYDLNRELIESYQAPGQITGLEYQVEACRKALELGELECAQMPHSSSIGVMELMDEARRQWLYRYPCEK